MLVVLDLDRPPVFSDTERVLARQKRIAAAIEGKRLCVFMGGDSGEREVSLRSGAGVAQALRGHSGARVATLDVHFESLELEAVSCRYDLIYNALHGGRGEDGTVQGYLDCVGVPYTGPGVVGCAVAMDKVVTSQLLTRAGIAVPEFVPVGNGDDPAAAMEEALDSIGLPLVTKPRREGSSLGVTFCRDEKTLRSSVADLVREYGEGLICELVPEPEVTVGILHGRPLGVLELRAKREFYDYTAKYTKGLTEFIIPAQLDAAVYAAALETAVAAAKVLQCAEMCRVDMRVAAEGTPKVMDVNTSPGMTETSDLPAGAAHVGLTYPQLTLEVVGTALVRAGLMDPEEWL